MIVFVDIGGIVDLHCLNFLFTTYNTVNSLKKIIIKKIIKLTSLNP